MLSELETQIEWMKKVIYQYNLEELTPSSSYSQQTKSLRNRNAKAVRRGLDRLRSSLVSYTPEDLLKLKNEVDRESQGIKDFSGLYILFNRTRVLYYVGQSTSVFDSAYKHFVMELSHSQENPKITSRYEIPEVYTDYIQGNEFTIQLIPIDQMPFSTLKEAQENAIRAYDSIIPCGYNKNPGVIIERPLFPSSELWQVAETFLSWPSEKTLSSLAKDKKRLEYITHQLGFKNIRTNALFKHLIVDYMRMFHERIPYKPTYKKTKEAIECRQKKNCNG